jgi:MYXO-CTERM domain-containing protein
VTNTGGAFTANYTVAAVPEADGIAMALAGLGALGFVALRRRQS